MKCDELQERWFEAYPIEGDQIIPTKVYVKKDTDDAIAELKDENQRLKKKMDDYHLMSDIRRAKIKELKRALWLMTAEWAEGMGLASCNIAIKLSVKERFFYHDEANREKDIKKYRHRQVVFYKYADYCRAKAEEYNG